MIKAILLSINLVLALAPGDKVPDFKAKNQDGKTVQLNDYKGKFVLLYFYPKDETPGCTTEAQCLRDKYSDIKKLNGEVLGVSRQDENSHQKFRAKENLPFDLLVDKDGSLGKLMGIGSMPVLGLSKRQSVLISPEGKVVKFYDDVNPEKHADEVIADLKAASTKK
jgi:peroxiredoxin Q/BCP